MSKVLQNTVETACRLVVLAAVLFSAFGIVSFVVAFFDGSLMNSRLDAAAEAIISLHADVLTSAIGLILVMLFRRSLNAFWLAVPLLAAFGFGAYDFQDNVLHPLIVSSGAYDLVTRGGQAGVTPQVTRSVILMTASLALLGLCLSRRTRTMDRVFVLLIAGSVIVTTFIFHLALPMGTLRFEKDRIARLMLAEARLYPIDSFCADRTCLFLGDGFVEAEGKRHAPHPLPPHEFVQKSAPAVIEGGHSTKYVRSTSFNGTTFAIDGCVPRKDYRPPMTRYLCFSDAEILTDLGRTTAAWMGFLSSVAHSTWLFGGVFLIWFHKRRFRRRNHPKPA